MKHALGKWLFLIRIMPALCREYRGHTVHKNKAVTVHFACASANRMSAILVRKGEDGLGYTPPNKDMGATIQCILMSWAAKHLTPDRKWPKEYYELAARVHEVIK